MPLGEHVIHDYRSLGLSLKAHPLAFLRQRLDRIGVTPNARLASVRDGSRVSVAGLVLVRQRPGKGNAIFLTLEDEKGVANVIIWSRMFERFRPIIMGSKFVRVSGRLQSESDVIHIVAERFRGPYALARRSPGNGAADCRAERNPAACDQTMRSWPGKRGRSCRRVATSSDWPSELLAEPIHPAKASAPRMAA